jgi:hypothetical protein
LDTAVLAVVDVVDVVDVAAAPAAAAEHIATVVRVQDVHLKPTWTQDNTLLPYGHRLAQVSVACGLARRSNLAAALAAAAGAACRKQWTTLSVFSPGPSWRVRWKTTSSSVIVLGEEQPRRCWNRRHLADNCWDRGNRGEGAAFAELVDRTGGIRP